MLPDARQKHPPATRDGGIPYLSVICSRLREFDDVDLLCIAFPLLTSGSCSKTAPSDALILLILLDIILEMHDRPLCSTLQAFSSILFIIGNFTQALTLAAWSGETIEASWLAKNATDELWRVRSRYHLAINGQHCWEYQKNISLSRGGGWGWPELTGSWYISVLFKRTCIPPYSRVCPHNDA